ncbi:jg8774 [Pararge aegeria aegeria]|uniref:Jg8774 protein n=1 Tax=Pararge aegeria aegeria TaxID=348720 RepID=A0A8S4S324_9NEOP|nr:jg8774 [Pararge aegeria aegeria]
MTSTTTTPQPTTTQKPREDNDSLSCDFHHSLCGWSNDHQADDKWAHNVNEIAFVTMTSIGTARLLSPVYDRALGNTGCFSLDYSMLVYNKLRVYQKPKKIELQKFVKFSTESKMDYNIFHIEGDLKGHWYTSVSMLKQFGDEFQIIIEVNSPSVNYVIAEIDNVAILQGSECATAVTDAVTPVPSRAIDVYYVNTEVPTTTTTISPYTSTTKQTNEMYQGTTSIFLILIVTLVVIILILVYILVAVLIRKRGDADAVNVLGTNIVGTYARRSTDKDTKTSEVGYSTTNADDFIINCN